MVDRGYSVGIVDLTRGEMGTRGTPELRAEEAEAARKVLGARFRTRMDLGDSKLTASIENRLALAQEIRNTHSREQLFCRTGTAVTPITTPRLNWVTKRVSPQGSRQGRPGR